MLTCVRITTNADGVAYLRTSGINVTADTVDYTLGFRSIKPMGYMTIKISDAIPDGTTGTLPVRFAMNGSTKNLTFFGGTNVTAADLVGTGVITVFYNWYDDLLQLVSPLAPATA